MTDDAEDRQPATTGRRRIALVLAVLVVVLVVLFVPPLIGINHYKSRITQLMTASFGRPVRLSSVELRLLPWPGFVLTDLSVAEDPAYGAEPVLYANTVIASIRLTSLWRGRMEISRISVDEASLNLVRASPGQWNVNALFRTAAAHAGAGGASSRPAARLPYLEATNSRINIKNDTEKLPFSLIETDLSFWQDDSGAWRIRLRGQPVRTDLSLDLGDTGVMRLEASMGRAPSLQRMPVHLDLDWREAQLGQLARLIIGADPGWRGDLTGQLQLDGTPEAAQVKIRLRATGVHRAEFAPQEPLDFDANCSFLYHSSQRAVEKLVCDSPLGQGLVHMTGQMAGGGAPPRLSLELDRVPVAAGLGVLRTVRNTLTPDLEAQGTVSGKLAYAAGATPAGTPSRTKKTNLPPQSPLTGSLTVEGLGLSGAGLSQPLQFPRIELVPVAPTAGASSPALAVTAVVAAGAASPLTISMSFALEGYQATVRGQASVKWARDLAHVTGLAEAGALDNLAGDPIAVDLTAQGRWQPDALVTASTASADKLTGSVVVHNANWKSDYLANHVEIAQAALHFENGQLNWDPVDFSYGPVKGTASLALPASCPVNEPCVSEFQLHFADLNASDIEASFLGAHKPGTLLSNLIARLQPQQAPSWPEMSGTVKADSLRMGQVTLVEPSATLLVHPGRAEFSDLDAGLLGGHLHATGSLRWAGTDQHKPAYTVEARFEKLSPEAVGQLLGESWAGGFFDADGKIDLSGFTDRDLAASAKGTLQFEWRRGAIEAGNKGTPAALARFDDWKADIAIANGAMTLGKNQVMVGTHKLEVEGDLILGDPPKVRFAAAKEARVSRR